MFSSICSPSHGPKLSRFPSCVCPNLPSSSCLRSLLSVLRPGSYTIVYHFLSVLSSPSCSLDTDEATRLVLFSFSMKPVACPQVAAYLASLSGDRKYSQRPLLLLQCQSHTLANIRDNFYLGSRLRLEPVSSRPWSLLNLLNGY